MVKTLIVCSRVKEVCKMYDTYVSKELASTLEAQAEKILIRACNRAKENNRTTVLPRDI